MASSRIFSKLLRVFNTTNENEVDRTVFHRQFSLEDNGINGLYIGNTYIPEEIILNIFTYLNCSDILNCSLVCKRWHNIAKSNILWQTIYNQKEYPKKAKNLPWYVFYSYFTSKEYFTNLVKNGNGQEKYKYWKIIYNAGDKFRIEDPPCGSDPLPEGITDFNGFTSCFATSFQTCFKIQKIDLSKNKLLKYIIGKYKPTLYASEWYCGRFDCACIYKLLVVCDNMEHQWHPEETNRMPFSHLETEPKTEEVTSPFYSKFQIDKIAQWEGRSWQKMEITSNNYPANNMDIIYFGHEGQDCQFWAGHYGSKMAGGVLKFLFDSIEPTSEDMSDTEEELRQD